MLLTVDTIQGNSESNPKRIYRHIGHCQVAEKWDTDSDSDESDDEKDLKV